MIKLLIFPVVLASISLFLNLLIFGNNLFVWIGSLVFAFIMSFLLLKEEIEYVKRIKFNPSILIFFIIIFFYILFKAAVLTPVIKTINQEGFEHIQITDVGDYYKHIFVTTALSIDGVPPSNPYFPSSKLSYYYGYYLVPAAIVKIFNVYPSYALFGFALYTSFLSLLIFLIIIYTEFKTFKLRLATFLLTIFGSGIDVIGFLFSKLSILKPFGDLVLKQGGEQGLQLINTYKAMLFVPQHFFASAVTVAVIYYLIKEKKGMIFISLCFSFVFLSSFFAAITLFVWVVLVFIFFKEKRWLIFRSGIIAVLILIPYFSQLSDRGSTLYFYKFSPFDFFALNDFKNYVLDFLITILISYGPVLLLLPVIFLILGNAFAKTNLFYFLLIFVPVILTWFIRSPLYNDFSLRTMMPVQIVLPIIFIKFLGDIKLNKTRKIVFVIVVLATIAGIAGFYFEYLTHWKNRSVLAPRDSEVILAIRNLPADIKIATLDRDRWVEFIPSLGFKKVLSSYLFDSYNYIAGQSGYEHGKYENLALSLFVNENNAPDLEKLIDNQNENFKNLNTFFAKYNADQLIVNNKIWFKKDINPWIKIFNEFSVSNKSLTGDFTIFDYKEIQNKTSQNTLVIDKTGKIGIKIVDNKFTLKKGLWYIASCASPENPEVKLELEDYYLLFNHKSISDCSGKMFYLQEDEVLNVNHSSTVKDIFVYPIKII